MVMAASAAMTAVNFILGSALRVEWYCGNAMQMKETSEGHCSSQTNVTYHPHPELPLSFELIDEREYHALHHHSKLTFLLASTV